VHQPAVYRPGMVTHKRYELVKSNNDCWESGTDYGQQYSSKAI